MRKNRSNKAITVAVNKVAVSKVAVTTAAATMVAATMVAVTMAAATMAAVTAIKTQSFPAQATNATVLPSPLPKVVKNHQNSKKLVAQVMNLSLLLPSLMPKKPVAKSMWQIYVHNKKEMVFLPLLIPM